MTLTWQSCALCETTIDTAKNPETWDADTQTWICDQCRKCPHGLDERECYECASQGK